MTALRQRTFKDEAIGMALCDLDAAISKVDSVFVKRTFDDVYTVPMYFGFPGGEPFAVLLVRVRDLSLPEDYVIHETSLSYTWESTRKRIRVPEIWDLEIGTKYRFSILAVM